jgi:hypothetical protein
MTLLVKAHAAPLTIDQETALSVRLHKHAHLEQHSIAYIWFCEQPRGDVHKGGGLAGRGRLINAAKDGSLMTVRLLVDRICTGQGLGKADLKDHRDDQADAVLHSLAHRLYFSSHTVVTDISDVEAELLETSL